MSSNLKRNVNKMWMRPTAKRTFKIDKIMNNQVWDNN